MQGEYRAYTIRDLVDAAERAYVLDGPILNVATFDDIQILIGATHVADLHTTVMVASLDRIEQHPEESEKDFAEGLDALHQATKPVPQADARITFENHIEQASEYTFKIDSIAGESRDSLTREILKLALTNEKAWFALRRVFLEHTCPERLDPLGREIRSILQQLDKDIGHGKSKTKKG